MRFLNNKNILLISPDKWKKSFVSKHHYAVELSKRNNVYFLNPPSQNFSCTPVSDRLYIINYKPILRGLRYFPDFLSARIIKYELELLEKRLQPFDIVWNFDTSRFFSLGKLRNKILRIAQIMDSTENFQRTILCKTSDLCFTCSQFLEKELKQFNRNSHFINHGFSPKVPVSYKFKTLNGRDRISAGYAGNLASRYLDWELILKVVSENSKVDFYFFGPTLPGCDHFTYNLIKQISKFPNVVLAGEYKSQELQLILEEMDILCVFYSQDDQWKEQLANTHKMMNYLGTGKVIVSTEIDYWKQFDELIVMSHSPEDFCRKFSDTLKDLDFHNSKRLKLKRKRIAANNTYTKNLEAIDKTISEYAGLPG